MTTVNDLLRERARVQQCVEQIRGAIQDIHQARHDGQQAAGYAVAWASVMMVTNILRIGLSAGDRRAALLFPALDRAIGRADKVMQFFGHQPMTTRADLMASLDPNLRSAASLIKDVREAQAFLARFKLNPPKPLKLMLDLGLGMTEDTLLMLQGGQLQQQVNAMTGGAVQQSTRHLQAMLDKLRRLDAQIIRALEQLNLYQHTA